MALSSGLRDKCCHGWVSENKCLRSPIRQINVTVGAQIESLSSQTICKERTANGVLTNGYFSQIGSTATPLSFKAGLKGTACAQSALFSALPPELSLVPAFRLPSWKAVVTDSDRQGFQHSYGWLSAS